MDRFFNPTSRHLDLLPVIHHAIWQRYDLGDQSGDQVTYPQLDQTELERLANKHKNIRAAQCFNLKSTKLSRLHNDANIITLGARLISKKNALRFISVFLDTKFEGGRHLKRVRKI